MMMKIGSAKNEMYNWAFLHVPRHQRTGTDECIYWGNEASASKQIGSESTKESRVQP